MLFNKEELIAIAQKLISEAEEIREKFKSKGETSLRNGESCLQVGNIDVDSLCGQLNSVIESLCSRITGVANFIPNIATADYESAAQAITNNFNGNLASQLSGILSKIGASVGSVAAGAVAAAGAARPVMGCGGSRPISASAPVKVISACGGSRPAPAKVISACGGGISKPVQGCFGGYSATPVVSSAPRL